jgi:hypothetical protein
MFKRIFVDDWALGLPVIAFFVFAAVFIVVTLRAIRIGRAERERLAALPLDAPESTNPSRSATPDPHE